MSESVIFNTPILLIGYALALGLCILSIKGRIGGYVIPILSAFTCVVTTTYALLKGAGLYEVSMAVMIFLFLNLVVYRKGGEEK